MGRTGAVREGRVVRLLRGLSGLLAGGLVALALALVVAWFLADQRAVAGPGAATLAGHAAAAVVAVAAQLVCDRRRGTGAALAALAVVLVTAVVLAVQWLA